jgi:sec-independent protein translocase protein TatC
MQAMTLTEHLGELRNRLVKISIAVLLSTVAIWNYYPSIFAIIRKPFDDIHAQHTSAILALTGVTSGFSLQLRVSMTAGIVIASPIWIFQIWRFISPGLKHNERRWAYIFTALAAPLFMSGVFLAYYVMPRMLDILFQFTPDNVNNVTSVDTYLSFFTHLVLFFGIGFLLPLVLMMLNFAGILRGETLRNAWRWLILGAFIFGAIATPNGDPVAMTVVAIPMIILSFTAVGVALLNDRRKQNSFEESLDQA